MASEAVKNFTDDNFDSDVLKSDAPVLVDFWAPWCAPCRRIAPLIDQLADENPNASIGKVNIEEAPRTAEQYQINSIPAILVFKQGEIVANFMGGAINKAKIQESLDELAG